MNRWQSGGWRMVPTRGRGESNGSSARPLCHGPRGLGGDSGRHSAPRPSACLTRCNAAVRFAFLLSSMVFLILEAAPPFLALTAATARQRRVTHKQPKRAWVCAAARLRAWAWRAPCRRRRSRSPAPPRRTRPWRCTGAHRRSTSRCRFQIWAFCRLRIFERSRGDRNSSKLEGV